MYGAEIYGEAVPQYERPAPAAEEPQLPAYEPLFSAKQVCELRCALPAYIVQTHPKACTWLHRTRARARADTARRTSSGSS